MATTDEAAPTGKGFTQATSVAWHTLEPAEADDG